MAVAGAGHGRWSTSPAEISRYVVRRHLIADPAGPAEAFAHDLSRIVEAGRYEAIVATADRTLARLASIDLSVPTFPEVGTASDVLRDKIALADIASRAGVPYPLTLAASTDEDVSVAVQALGMPAVVKAALSAEATALAVRTARGGRVVQSAEDALAAAKALRDRGLRPIVQQFVRPAAKLNAVVIRSGTTQLRYAHRVLRQTPVGGGIGVTLDSIPVETGDGAEAADMLERVCDVAGYSGLVHADFYRSADDDRLYLLDVNPRLWGSTWFAERLGLRVTERGVRLALGMPALPPTPYEIGRRFHASFGEGRWLRQQRSRTRALRELLRTTRVTDVFDYVDGSDPVPMALLALLVLRGYRPE